MKIIDAIWEERNLGLKTFEVIVSEEDSWKDLKDVIEKLSYEYLVIKIPPSRTDLMFKVSALGLVFVELVITAHFSGQNKELKNLEKRIIQSLCWSETTEENRNMLFEEISNGLFKTDRIAIDPNFGIKKSSQRYLGWIEDEIKLGSVLYQITKEGNLIGFFLLKKNGPDSSTAILAGLLEKYQRSGLGFVLNHFEIEASNQMGSSTVYSTFSANNRGALAIHMSMGYTVDRQLYVYVKHDSLRVI
jgi:hypothetical protein